MGKRRRVVVDIESTGLDVAVHVPVEVAWWCLSSGDRGRFVPPHDDFDMALAEPRALEINRYWDRGLDNPGRWDWDGEQLRRLHTVLEGARMTGSNPRFDAAMLAPLFAKASLNSEPCHHRLLDVANYAMGVLGLDDPEGLFDLCRRLDVTPGDHTAEGDVTATGLCLEALERHRWLSPAAHGLVVLDPASAEDVERLTRIALKIPAGSKPTARERTVGRTMLRQLQMDLAS